MRKITPYFAVPVALGIALGMMGCPTAPKPDLDDSAEKPDLPRIPPDFEVKDSLDAKKGDKVDWKKFSATATGKGKLRVHFGGFDGKHDITGEAEVYSAANRASLAKVAISPAEGSYNLQFQVEENADYYFMVSATQGASPYAVYLEIEEPPKDPCLTMSCGDNAECINGECVTTKSDVCDPECGRGMYCNEGTCEKACADGCPRGHYCDDSENECVKDPCYGKKCGSGERCRYGRCVKIEKDDPCDKCTANETCTGGKCVPKATDPGEEPPPTDGPVKGMIIQLIPQGKNTVIVINRGAKAGVKVGDTGTISGAGKSFRVSEVYTFRSKAVVAAELKDIGDSRSFTIPK